MPNSEKYFPADRPNSELLEVALGALLNEADDSRKQMPAANRAAEDECAAYLVKHLGDGKIRVLGVETLQQFPNLDLTKQHFEGYGSNAVLKDGSETRITAIVDVTGSGDLVARNLGNWCATIVFFRPGPDPKILFSMIHNSDGNTYGADETGTFFLTPAGPKGAPLQRLKGPDKRPLSKHHDEKQPPDGLDQIAICFDGQRSSQFTSLPYAFSAWLTNNPARNRIRIYNLAGNSMMARLANGENVHAIFSHAGELPHDLAPGAYIALKAGAHLLDFDVNKITADDLAIGLLKPSRERLRYVLAGTEELAQELAHALRESKNAFFKCVSGCDSGTVMARDSHPPTCAKCGQQMKEYDRRQVVRRR
ncbi:MAG TPA: hypothetical protein VLV89_05525 [Candidatus Acidoferrum sp.]|nr:hypothetical protein [Candidatus Acidoferrum sp.]